MKARLFAAIAMLISFASPAFAAGREDHSGLVVWVFLGFCGLIIVAQLVPAVLMMLGLVKGVAQGSKQPVEQKVRNN